MCRLYNTVSTNISLQTTFMTTTTFASIIHHTGMTKFTSKAQISLMVYAVSEETAA